MKIISFEPKAFEEYGEWAEADIKIFNRINDLIKSISRTPFKGEGKPEPLKHNFSRYWSRRINKMHRLVYKISEKNEIIIISCKYHYS